MYISSNWDDGRYFVEAGKNLPQLVPDFLTGGQSKWFEVLDLKPRWYWSFGYSGGGTLW
jgi:hypothetical protein